MNIIIVCATLLLCTIILAIVIYKSFLKLSEKLNSLNIYLGQNNDVMPRYSAKNIQIDNQAQIYENNIDDSISRMQERIFEKPIFSNDINTQEFSSDDDDIDDISKQLKGMNKNERFTV